ncbi:hypothetical protein PR048_012902 [Dryococelus australis]|uniref:DDE Tnp4 domain-containing protein n=1 Tax=Dryococelus australis TaxID=614101 RepID=A0ABQ9HRC8_9NEOP|nr:hypothetical protein PR048_012902 [Dryococelus australis]
MDSSSEEEFLLLTADAENGKEQRDPNKRRDIRYSRRQAPSRTKQNHSIFCYWRPGYSAQTIHDEARKDPRKDAFSDRLGRVQRLGENVFGILTMKWKIFLRPLELKVDKIKLAILSACLLHNVLRTKKCDDEY